MPPHSVNSMKERIITEAGILFARYGVRSITMDALAEDMGISKRTIYENFKDKDTLLNEVLNFYKELQLREAEEIINNSVHVVEAMFRILERSVNQMKQVNPLFFHDIKKYHPHTFRKIQDKGDIRDHTITMRILNEGSDQGIFREDINLEIANLTIHELFDLFSPESKFTQNGYHRGELFNNIILPYIIGIATDKGRRLIREQGPFKY